MDCAAITAKLQHLYDCTAAVMQLICPRAMNFGASDLLPEIKYEDYEKGEYYRHAGNILPDQAARP